ncbi:MFS multidrug transporter [Lasiodiplodia theobromae]|uniref:MFS multidrug transporter n=1 Tax=Lasiodiplodia theobromae TaxID=45133 RepID=UPI0015C308C9|nr:MFS multidrug transporter [Lasiodiplodia theobromae]KAF4535672.1 MFS multidrug transporter [Lasiodiplodia theobromae]
MSHSEKNIITWDGPDDPENPFNWPSSKKWRVTVLACSITFLSGISGTALAPTAPLLTSTFHLAPDATRTIPPTYYPIFAWTLSAGVIPLLLLPLMETYYGVRTPYLLCVLTLALSTIPQALAPGGADGGAYPLLIAIRILTGGAAGVLQNVTGGIVGDVWAGPRARSKPVALYIWALVGGLMAGPVVGGGTVWGGGEGGGGGLSWRYVCWEQLAIYAALVPLAYLLLPETRGAIILVRRAAAVRKATGDPNVRAEGEEEAGGGGMSLAELLKDAVGRPLRMLTTEPLVACSTLWSAFCFGNALLFTQSIPRVYGELYGWESWRAGVVQAGLLVGVTLGLVVGAPVQDALYYTTSSLRKRNQHQSSDSENGNNEEPEHDDEEEHFTPEARLYLAIPASFLCLSGGLFLYAWTSSPHIHWLAPTSGLVLVGAGIFTVVTAASNYVEDAYSRYAASALAGVAFGENMTGAFLPLAEQPLYTNLDLRWASCLLAFVAVALSFAPVVMVWKGEAIRKRSPFIKEAMYETQGEFVGAERNEGPQSV